MTRRDVVETIERHSFKDEYKRYLIPTRIVYNITNSLISFKEELESRSCNSCKHDWCGCSVQASILRIDSEVRFDSFCCNKWEAK